MTRLRRPRWGPATTIRVRLGVALALALLPVLLLGAAQSALSFNHERLQAKSALQAAAQRSAATTRARMEAAAVLLETLTPGSVGLTCAHRLHDISRRLSDYANLIRFDSIGRVECAAESVPADPERRNRPWFARLPDEREMTVVSRPGVDYAREPAILAAVRASNPDGSFAGALAAVIPLAKLRPEADDPGLPRGAEVAISDRSGNVLSTTNAKAFPPCRAHGPSGPWPPTEPSPMAATATAARGYSRSPRWWGTSCSWCCRPPARACCPGPGSIRCRGWCSRCWPSCWP